MRPQFDPSGLKKAKSLDYVIRFVFGGIITVAAGLAAKAWGPVIGGLFLGFPAILPASLTLVKQRDGRPEAIDDARGGRLGSLGLLAFGALVWARARQWPPAVTLIAALAAWLAVDLLLWWWRYGKNADR